MVYSGDWGKLFHEKNQKSKISWHCPFKQLSGLDIVNMSDVIDADDCDGKDGSYDLKKNNKKVYLAQIARNG